MYDYHFHASPNTYKVSMFFEELNIDYRTFFVNVGAGEQFKPDFVKISPNSKVPVIIDHDPAGGGEPIVMFESGAILLYLAEKHGRLIPKDLRDRADVVKWLFWQVANQGPMCGQSAHFNMFAPDVTYARKRYIREALRLFGVLERQLKDREFVAGSEYSIADIACYPWTEDRPRICFGLETLDDFPAIKRWSDAVASRPATIRAYERLKKDEKAHISLEIFAQNMFGQTPEQAKISAQNARSTMEKAGIHLAKT